MKEKITITNENVFHLSGRRLLKDLKSIKEIKIFANAFYIDNDAYNNSIVFEEDEIIIGNSKEFPYSSNVVSVCANLGKYIINNPDLYEDLKNKYNKFRKIEFLNVIKYSRHDSYLNESKLNQDIDIYEDLTPKLSKDTKFKKLLKSWFNECGIDTNEYKTFKNFKVIPIEYLFEIIDFSKNVYTLLEKFINKELKDTLKIDLSFLITQNSTGDLIIKKKVTDFNNLIYLLMTTYRNGNYTTIQQCEICNDFFFGKKSKKTCSQVCKDIRNKKYEKRKLKNSQKREEKSKRSDSICCEEQI